MFEPFVPLLQIFYASLLKISTLANRGLGRLDAVGRLRAYLHWATEDFGCIAALPLQAAVAIFGGDSLARKLIGVGAGSLSLQKVWGGAWDIFYVHHLYQAALTEIGGLPHYPIFVTRDRASYEIFAKSRLKGAIRFDAGRQLIIVGVSSDYPHYAATQAELLKLFGSAALSRIERLVGGTRMTQAHLETTIRGLELEWRRSAPTT